VNIYISSSKYTLNYTVLEDYLNLPGFNSLSALVGRTSVVRNRNKYTPNVAGGIPWLHGVVEVHYTKLSNQTPNLARPA
jgi:hypothetical protein